MQNNAKDRSAWKRFAATGKVDAYLRYCAVRVGADAAGPEREA